MLKIRTGFEIGVRSRSLHFYVSLLGLLVTSTYSQAGLAPVIAVEPRALSLPLHGSGSISVVVSNPGGASYKWYRNGRRVDGAAGSILLLSNVTSRVAGNYHVEISNSKGNTVSSNAVLTVVNPPLTITGMKMTPTGMQIRLDNLTATSCVIYTSSDLAHWTAVSTNRVSAGTVVYTDSSALKHPVCFYKVREHATAQFHRNHRDNDQEDDDECDRCDEDDSADHDEDGARCREDRSRGDDR